MFLFCKHISPFAMFFFALMQKRTKKNQGKREAPPLCHAPPPPV
jgi:hypothetical protein